MPTSWATMYLAISPRLKACHEAFHNGSIPWNSDLSYITPHTLSMFSGRFIVWPPVLEGLHKPSSLKPLLKTRIKAENYLRPRCMSWRASRPAGSHSKIQSIPDMAWQLPEAPQGWRRSSEQFGRLLLNNKMNCAASYFSQHKTMNCCPREVYNKGVRYREKLLTHFGNAYD